MTSCPLAARLARAALVSLALFVASGCIVKPAWMKPAPARSWPQALSEARVAVARGSYEQADKRLMAFVKAFPDTPEAVECDFWRALFHLDPANPKVSPRQAIETLDRYLASPPPRMHDTEARVLRRTAALLEKQSRATVTRTELETRNKDRDEELQRTKDELAKAIEELERIKRRLASPKP